MQIEVSILIAARNEEKNIENCLNSLLNQHFNNNVNIELLIGNDDSYDNTKKIVDKFIRQYSHIHCVDVPQNRELKGKINVIDYLSEQAKGKYLLFADADVVYPYQWVETMYISLKSHDIATGVTTVEGKGNWLEFQRLDWLLALKQIEIFSKINIPLTAMGNNMGITRTMFDKIGGVRKLPFTVAEDFAIFQSIISQNGSYEQLYSRKVLAKTVGVDSMDSWLSQRWRWMQGAKKLPIYLVVLNYLNITLYPLLIIISFFNPQFGVLIPTVYFFKMLSLVGIQYQLSEKVDWWSVLLFDLYHTYYYNRLLLYSLFSPPVEWKGRVYNSE
ncbi:glycosyltransferase [Flammeovirga sp. SubArs3]|uniref:glycosyltransferase n=1 Tax=Flammeovirga sp. SubArs3 TaxID=2995316 RepID=UPI00248AF524|nr:glycosyltransferase [Flammeovirga sp. SubArs3]